MKRKTREHTPASSKKQENHQQRGNFLDQYFNANLTMKPFTFSILLYLLESLLSSAPNTQVKLNIVLIVFIALHWSSDLTLLVLWDFYRDKVQHFFQSIYSLQAQCLLQGGRIRAIVETHRCAEWFFESYFTGFNKYTRAMGRDHGCMGANLEGPWLQRYRQCKWGPLDLRRIVGAQLCTSWNDGIPD